MDKALKKDIWLYYLFSFLIGFYIANGTTVLFARELHLSYSQIFLLTAVYMLMFVLFEIPSGALADLIGRKKTIIFGGVALGAAAGCSGLAQNFLQLFLSYFLWSIGFSSISGANEALLYDRVSDQEIFSQAVGRSGFFWIVGTAVAGIVGPYLFSLNFRLPYLASAIPFFLAALAILPFAETRPAQGQFSLPRHWEQIKTGIQIGYRNKFVLWGSAGLALIFATSYTFSNSYQPYLVDLGFSVKMFSVILPVMFLTQALGSFLFPKLLLFRESRLFAFCLLAIAAATMGLGASHVKGALAIVFFYMFLEGVARPLVSAYSNRYIDSFHRATVISVQSMVGTVTAAAMLFLIGMLTDRIGIHNVLLVLGAFILLVSIVLLMFKPKDQTA